MFCCDEEFLEILCLKLEIDLVHRVVVRLIRSRLIRIYQYGNIREEPFL